jgi:hypothetical protein
MARSYVDYYQPNDSFKLGTTTVTYEQAKVDLDMRIHTNVSHFSKVLGANSRPPADLIIADPPSSFPLDAWKALINNLKVCAGVDSQFTIACYSTVDEMAVAKEAMMSTGAKEFEVCSIYLYISFFVMIFFMIKLGKLTLYLIHRSFISTWRQTMF